MGQVPDPQSCVPNEDFGKYSQSESRGEEFRLRVEAQLSLDLRPLIGLLVAFQNLLEYRHARVWNSTPKILEELSEIPRPPEVRADSVRSR